MLTINLNMIALHKHFISLSAAVFLICMCTGAYGQTDGDDIADNLDKADIFHRNYQFEKAIEYYSAVLDRTTDSTLRISVMEKINNCQNGISMMQYTVNPVLVASGTFGTDNFYLYLNDTDDRSWIPIPNPFIKTSERFMHPLYTSMYMPANCGSVIFSAPDETGAWNLYTSCRKDSTTWSVPVLLSENLLSDKNEIFPMLSQDGKTLFFASDGLPGMGGYDIFFSRWDDDSEDWGIPENMGFPYSSTGNDILFLNSNDGLYSIIVSDRETDKDSVKIYVTEYINTPVKSPLGKNSPLRAASFSVADIRQEGGKDSGQDGTGEHSEETASYSRLMHELRRLQNEQREKLGKIAESRKIYENASESDREFLAEIIRDVETESINIKKQIDAITAKVRATEMQFLEKGMIPLTYEEEKPEPAVSVPVQKTEYTFSKHSNGKIPYIIVESPEPEFDYSFKILGRDQGQFVEDTSLPAGIVYQIQFAVLSSHAGIRDIRGMSPVFVTRMPSGKYLHAAGLFSTYQEALSNLNKVRKNGFKEAFIIAYNNGKSISVKNARNLEGKTGSPGHEGERGEMAYRIVLHGYSSSLPSGVIKAIQKFSAKDITRTSNEDGTVYAIGPFSSRKEAEDLLENLKGENITGITIESIKL